ncbi:hypothetical protein EJB05_56371, partial [Eragrostis curvula]
SPFALGGAAAIRARAPPRPRSHPDRVVFHSNRAACLLQLRPVDHEAVAQECFFELLALGAPARRHRNPSAAAVDARHRRRPPPLSPRSLSPAICADKWSRGCGHDPPLMEAGTPRIFVTKQGSRLDD